MVSAGSLHSVAAGIFPVHRIRQGVLTPPSNDVSLPCRLAISDVGDTALQIHQPVGVVDFFHDGLKE